MFGRENYNEYIYMIFPNIIREWEYGHKVIIEG